MANPAPAVRPIEDRRLLGIGIVLIGVFLISCMDAFGKYLVVSGIPAFQVAFFRHAVTLIIVVAIFAPRSGRALVTTRNLKLEIARGLCQGIGTLLNFAALMFLPLTTVGSIMFTMPLLVTALSVPLLGEKVGWRRWIAVFVGFVGVLIVIRPGSAPFHPAIFLAMGTAVIAALFNILNRKLAGVDSVKSQQFFAALVSVICLAPGAAVQWVWPSEGVLWALLIGLGLIGTTAHFLVTAAHRFAGASTLAPFFYPQIIFLSILSWQIFDQAPDIYMGIGALVVAGAGLYIWLRERDSQVQVAKSVPPTV